MKPQALKLRRLLRQAGDEGLTTGQIAEHGILRVGARVAELREAGERVVTKRLASNRFRYFIYTPLGGQSAEPEPDPAGSSCSSNPTPDEARPSPSARRGVPDDFDYERPPSVVGEWIRVFEIHPGEPVRFYWERMDVSRQQELVAA